MPGTTIEGDNKKRKKEKAIYNEVNPMFVKYQREWAVPQIWKAPSSYRSLLRLTVPQDSKK